MLLTKKYSPKNLEEIKDQKEIIIQLKHLVLNKIPVILSGPVGCGKTCSVYALANELNYEILEVNASDTRNKEKINLIIGNSFSQLSLFKKGKIILIDDIDGLSGTKDRGGIQALSKILQTKNTSIVLTANDPYLSKLSPLRKKAKILEFNQPSTNSIVLILKDISIKEKINYEEKILKKIAIKSKGDIRSAINDLQSSIVDNNLRDLDFGERDKKENIETLLNLIFKTKDAEAILEILDNLDINLDETLLWINENLPSAYNLEDLPNAYNFLSKSDVFRGRIMRWQYWRFLVYQKILMSVGVALSKKEKLNSKIKYKQTKRLLKIWLANRKYAKRKLIAEKLASYTHISTKKAIQELPYLKNIISIPEIANTLELTDEELTWISQ